ncbi:MAG: alpha/beta hydrolase [Myxococcales bacterium]|jgi:acetyl esterase/lipase
MRVRQLIRDFAVVVLAAWTIFVTGVRRLVRGPKHPAWSFRFELTVEVVRATMKLGHERMSIALRRKQPVLPMPARIARRVRIERETLSGVGTEIITPLQWEPGDPTYLHYHGGAYSMCSPATHRLMLARIALAAGARVVVPNYRKAPEHPFPVPVDDGHAVYRHLLEEGVGPDTLVVGGDSAGGGMALAVMQRARREGLAMPRAAVLLSPWVDLTATAGATIDSNHHLDYLSGPMLVSAIGDYLGDQDPAHPEASPIYADLRGLPPLLIHTGGGEIFLDQNMRLADRARAAGVQVVHEVSDGMVHVFQLVGPVQAARTAIRAIGNYVRASVAPPAP